MKILVRKMEKLGLLKFVLMFYAIIMMGLALVIPVSMIAIDITLMANPTVLALSIIDILFFGLLGYFTFIKPYFVYRNLPTVLAETDGEFVYFHGKKEAKISLNDLSYCYMDVDVPHIFHPGFLREFIIHKFSSDYGSITLDVPNHGSIKLQFVVNAEEVGKELLNYINENSDDL